MDRVVYFLGAGFSAPLGLPLMSNFMRKAKELYDSNPSEHEHFEEVFQTIDQLSVSKNYYRTDLFNIEEILSILEMRELLRGEAKVKKVKRQFIKYISDVIEHYTPSIRGYEENTLPSNWEGVLFGNIRSDTPYKLRSQAWYGYFVAHLLGLQFHRPAMNKTPVELEYSRIPEPNVLYWVVTVNYDLILETYANYIKETFSKQGLGSEPDAKFLTAANIGEGIMSNPFLAKLHGSVDTQTLVPPTWNKAIGEDVIPQWRFAAQLLANANHVRIVGYSLPTTDIYMKYLLRSAVVDTLRLKSIDVLCLDQDGSVRERYDEFIDFGRYRFVSGSILDYLETLTARQVNYGDVYASTLAMDKLENAHEEFFASRA